MPVEIFREAEPTSSSCGTQRASTRGKVHFTNFQSISKDETNKPTTCIDKSSTNHSNDFTIGHNAVNKLLWPRCTNFPCTRHWYWGNIWNYWMSNWDVVLPQNQSDDVNTKTFRETEPHSMGTNADMSLWYVRRPKLKRTCKRALYRGRRGSIFAFCAPQRSECYAHRV